MPFQRPILPYNETLPNSNRYEVLSNLANQLPPTAEMLDADVNYLIDMGNTLEQQIINIVAGNIPGSNNPLNANLFLTTDGASNLSWSLVRSNQYADLSINNNAIANSAISSRTIQDGAIITSLIAPQAVTGSKIADNTITNNNILDNSIGGGKILANSIGGAKLVDRTIGELKIALGAVATGNIQAGAITAPLLANNCVATGNIQTSAVKISNLKMAIYYATIAAGVSTPIYTQNITGFSKINDGIFAFTVATLPGFTTYVPLAVSVYGVGMLAANVTGSGGTNFTINVVRISTGAQQDPTSISVCVLYN